jgi:hypothetical protein
MTTNNEINNTLPSTWTMSSTSANNLLYASSANTITGLATAIIDILVTNGSGVPSFSLNSPSGLTVPQPLIQGVTTASNAAAGNVGEFISSNIVFGSAVSISTTVAKDLTSISLTAGDWDVMGNIYFNGTLITSALSWINTASATPPDNSLITSTILTAGSPIIGQNAPWQRINVSSTTTVYISVNATFTSTATICGGIYARRIR